MRQASPPESKRFPNLEFRPVVQNLDARRTSVVALSGLREPGFGNRFVAVQNNLNFDARGRARAFEEGREVLQCR